MARLTAEQEQQAVEMWTAGAKMKDIVAKTGIPQSTVYSLLARHGKAPLRGQRTTALIKGGAEGLRMTFDTMLQRLEDQALRIAELEAENERLKARIKRLTGVPK